MALTRRLLLAQIELALNLLSNVTDNAEASADHAGVCRNRPIASVFVRLFKRNWRRCFTLDAVAIKLLTLSNASLNFIPNFFCGSGSACHGRLLGCMKGRHSCFLILFEEFQLCAKPAKASGGTDYDDRSDV